MAFTRWDPLRDLLALQERIDRLTEAGDTGWTPPVDLYETVDRYVLTAELPGLTRDDLDIRFHDGQLQVQGRARLRACRASNTTASSADTARSCGASPCPPPWTADRISADLKDGVLTVTIPKAPSAVPRRIDVT